MARRRNATEAASPSARAARGLPDVSGCRSAARRRAGFAPWDLKRLCIHELKAQKGCCRKMVSAKRRMSVLGGKLTLCHSSRFSSFADRSGQECVCPGPSARFYSWAARCSLLRLQPVRRLHRLRSSTTQPSSSYRHRLPRTSTDMRVFWRMILLSRSTAE